MSKTLQERLSEDADKWYDSSAPSGDTPDLEMEAVEAINMLKAEIRQWRILINQDPSEPFSVSGKPVPSPASVGDF